MGREEMNYPWVDDYLLQKKAVQKDFKEEWGWYRYQIGEKMFAAVFHGNGCNGICHVVYLPFIARSI